MSQTLRRLAVVSVALLTVLVAIVAPTAVARNAGGDAAARPAAPASAASAPAAAGALNDPYYSDVIGTIAIRPVSTSTTTYTMDLRSLAVKTVLVSGIRKLQLTAVKTFDSNATRFVQWTVSATTLYRITVTYFQPGTRTASGSFSASNQGVVSIRSGGIGAATTGALEEVVFQQK